MGAPIGNNFWENRTKHGRDREIKDPKELIQLFNDYIKWVEDNPLYKSDAKVVSIGSGYGSKIMIAKIPIDRPYTKQGFSLFCGLSGWHVIEQYKEINKDFMQIITHIENSIYNQKFEGAAVNIFNSSIIARDLGLVEKTENKHQHKIEKNFPEWFNESIDETES
jgi:hypothetical protein